MDFPTLYNMAANAARNAERMCSQNGGQGDGGLPFQNYAGYPFYIDEYNRLLAFTAQSDPMVMIYFQPVDLGKHRNPTDVIGTDVEILRGIGGGPAELARQLPPVENWGQAAGV